MPSNQWQIIKQAKFTYSPIGKGFEKQIKAIEDQGEKQIKTLEEQGKQLVKSNGKKTVFNTFKTKQIFDELVNERMGEIQKFK